MHEIIDDFVYIGNSEDSFEYFWVPTFDYAGVSGVVTQRSSPQTCMCEERCVTTPETPA